MKMESIAVQLKDLRRPRKTPLVRLEDIPCIETSDTERLCRNPVVSVVMVTYNHERYIREAIESVLMQKTDFEFELIIGEDCSRDRTREICFEYQKRHPDRIRVLWWHENVSEKGGNIGRCIFRCRGEFIGYCEGDDFWTDPLKLQKEVDIIRRTNAGMCVANSRICLPDGRQEDSVYPGEGMLPEDTFFYHYFHTSTYLMRRTHMIELRNRYHDIRRWYDVTTVYTMAAHYGICLLPDIVSTYRQTGSGICTKLERGDRDLFYCRQMYDLFLHGPVDQRLEYLIRAVMALEAPLQRFLDGGSPDFLKRCGRSMFAAYVRLFFVDGGGRYFGLRHGIRMAFLFLPFVFLKKTKPS